MKIKVMSDLHLNWSQLEIPRGEHDSETILVLAGDICEVTVGKATYKEFFETVEEQFKLVLYVFGNHEYYDTSYIRAEAQLLREIGHIDKIKILDMDTIDVDDCRFIGCTLWTDMDKENPTTMLDAQSFMSDYNLIRMGNHETPYHRRLTPIDTVKEHKIMRQWVIEQCIQARLDGKKPVVITHHHPSFESVPERFKTDGLNGAYCSDMVDEVWENGPDLWFCGHIHDHIDYMINKTRVVCNPRGYVQRSGNTEICHDIHNVFDVNLSIEI